MNRFASALRLLILGSFVLPSCNLLSPQNSPTPPANITLIAPTSVSQPTANSVQPQSQHRIDIRQVNGAGEFYDKQTNDKFVPRGVNYVYIPVGSSHTIMLLRVGTYDPD